VTSRRRSLARDDGPPVQRRLARIVVVAMGSEWRGDDGVGTRVATSFAGRLAVDSLADCRVVSQLADPLDLLSHWAGAELAVIVDATRSGLAPGIVSLIRLEQPVSRLAGESGIEDRTAACAAGGRSPSSTHGIGLANVLRLAHAVDRAPRSVVICGVEGEDFGPGSELSPAVEAAVDKAVVVVLGLVEEVLACA
jgi:hydrogenase maturation protease